MENILDRETLQKLNNLLQQQKTQLRDNIPKKTSSEMRYAVENVVGNKSDDQKRWYIVRFYWYGLKSDHLEPS